MDFLKRINKTSVVLSVSWIVLFFFFYIYMYGHLQFLEQYQLLLYTKSYIGDLFCRPGGLSDLIGRFATQFCYARMTGAISMSILFLLTLVSSAKVIEYFTGRKASVGSLALPTALIIFLFNEYAQVSFVAALTLAHLFFIVISRIKRETVYLATMLTGVGGGYWLIGPAVIVYAVFALADVLFKRHYGKSMFIICSTIGILIIGIILSYRILPYHLHTLIWGVDYLRYSAETPLIMIICLIIPVLVIMAAHYTERFSSKINALWGCVVGYVICICIVAMNYIGAVQSEQFKQMDYWVRCDRWDKVVRIAEKEGPKSQLALVYTNLALGMEGQLSNRFGQFPQMGTRGLLNDWKRDCISAIPLAEVWYRLGNMNTALRYTVEAMESNTDCEKSGRALERMAEINIINGDYAVARKYCRILTDSWFYREKAERLLKLMDKPDLIEQNPEYAYMRRVRYNTDFFFNIYKYHPEEALKHLGMQNGENQLAREYYVVWMQMAQTEKRLYQEDEQVR